VVDRVGSMRFVGSRVVHLVGTPVSRSKEPLMTMTGRRAVPTEDLGARVPAVSG